MKHLVQLVITRKDAKTFKVATFDRKECTYSEYLDEEETKAFVLKTMKRLKPCNHL